jgi:hypothetical protein
MVEWGSVPDWVAAVGSIGSTAALVVTGYALTSRLAQRDKRRDVQVEFLLAAYRRLEACSHRPLDLNPDLARQFESALSDVALLGTPLQVRLATEVMEAMGQNQGAQLDSLLQDLRRLLRDELGLELDGTPYKYLRISTPADRAAEQEAIRLGEEQQGKIR